MPVYQAGDVLHRTLVRVDEVKESLAILHAAAKIRGHSYNRKVEMLHHPRGG